MELPVNEQVFGDFAQEIVEEYNEENEMEWREQHKIKIRENKKREAEERKQLISIDGDKNIWDILEEAEMMEELENELEELNVDDDQQLFEHLQPSGISIEKKHQDIKPLADESKTIENDSESDESGTKEFLRLSNEAANLSTTEKIAFYEEHLKKLDKYFVVNPENIENIAGWSDKRETEECIKNAIEEIREDINGPMASDDESKAEAPTTNEMLQTELNNSREEYNQCNERRKFMSRSDFDQIERDYEKQRKGKSELLIFYKSQLRCVMKSIAGSTFDAHARDEKRNLYDFLTDRIDQLRNDIHEEKQIQLEEDFVDDEDVEQHGEHAQESDSNAIFDVDDGKDDTVNGKRKISFASEPIVTTFHEDDEPWRVQIDNNADNINNLMDATFQFFNSPSSSSASSTCGDDDDAELSTQCIDNKNYNSIEFNNANGLFDKQFVDSTNQSCTKINVSRYF